MIYTNKFKTGLKDIGKNNKIKNRAILEMLENIGAYHSDIVGYGVKDTKTTKVSWILLDWKLKVIDRPTYGDELEIHTWARGINKFFTNRDYEIYDQNKKLCAVATSKWALINIETGKLSRLTEELINKYKPENKHVFEEDMKKIDNSDEISTSFEYTVIRKDIDINKHMHNLYYLDLAYEALPNEIYEKRPFNNVRISYKKEIKLGDTINCNYTQKDNKNLITIKSQDNKTIHAIIEIY